MNRTPIFMHGPPLDVAKREVAHLALRDPTTIGLVRVGNRNRGSAALLAILLGGFGAHRFYLGRPISGALYLVFFWTGIPVFIALFEGLGYLMTSRQMFDLKHNARLL